MMTCNMVIKDYTLINGLVNNCFHELILVSRRTTFACSVSHSDLVQTNYLNRNNF